MLAREAEPRKLELTPVPDFTTGGETRPFFLECGVVEKKPAFEESADTMHGRLLESVHITGYTMERACIGLEWLLEEDRWKTIGDGFEDIDAFLDTINLSDINVTRRKKLAKKLDEVHASQRATARALGVNEITVARDLGKKRGATSVDLPSLSDKELEDGTATDVAPERPNPLTTEGSEAARTVGKQVTKAFDKAQQYGHDQGDEWFTPKWLFDALGIRFSIDVCSPKDLTHVTTPADKHFNEDDDGLKQLWSGTIWCNPPYSDPEPWALKCVKHANGLLLTHIPMNAGWCIEVWQTCDAIRLFQAIEFVRPDGTTQRPGTWLQLAAWGKKATKALLKLKIPADIAENPRRVPSPMWIRADDKDA